MPARSPTPRSRYTMHSRPLLGPSVIELHITNVHRREEFRHHSHISFAATAIICGLGPQRYDVAVEQAARLVAF
ncbi:type II 3-dehydroquinate dehydratase [Ensifer sp. 4252]|uniref:type II 3-dehydroquinate dehydratase n=1 Tax=Ensifer sp. 4252 TaxID=3373915 RepID=UPI003D23396B